MLAQPYHNGGGQLSGASSLNGNGQGAMGYPNYCGIQVGWSGTLNFPAGATFTVFPNFQFTGSSVNSYVRYIQYSIDGGSRVTVFNNPGGSWGGWAYDVGEWRIFVINLTAQAGTHTVTVYGANGYTGSEASSSFTYTATSTSSPLIEWSTGGIQSGIYTTSSVLLNGERYTGQAKGTEPAYPSKLLSTVFVWLDSGAGFNPFAFNGGGSGQSNLSDPNGPTGTPGLYRFRAQATNNASGTTEYIYHGLRVLASASTSASFALSDGWATAINPGTTGVWQYRFDRLGLLEKSYASAGDSSTTANTPLSQKYSLATPEAGWWNSAWGAWSDPANSTAVVGSDWMHAGRVNGQPVSSERVFVATKRNAGNPAATFDYLFSSDIIKRKDAGNGNFGDGVLLEAYKINNQSNPATVSRVWSSLQARGASDGSGDIPTGAVLFPVALAWGDEVVLRSTAHTPDNSYDNITFKNRDSDAQSNFTVSDLAGANFTNVTLSPLGGTNSDTGQINSNVNVSNRRVNLSAGTFLMNASGAGGSDGLVQMGATSNVVLQGDSGGGTVLKVSGTGIKGGGFAGWNSRRSLFYFGGARNIVIKDLTIDVAPDDKGYVQGTITAVNTSYASGAATEVEISLDQTEGAPLTTTSLTGSNTSFFDYWSRTDPTNKGSPGYGMAYSSSAYTTFQSNPSAGLKPLPGKTAVQVAYAYPPTYDPSWVLTGGRLSKARVYFVQQVPGSNPATYQATHAFDDAVGAKIVVVRRTIGEQMMYLSGCTGLSFQNVKIRNAYGLSIEVAGGYGFSLNGVKFERAQNSQIIVAPGDGLHFHDGVSGPTVENCVFDGLADDGINIYAATAGLSHGFVIRNNTFRNIRGRAALIQAGYGLFAENKIIDLTRWGINLANEDVANGSPIRDLLIRNNSFDRVADDTSHGGYAIFANGVNPANSGGANILPNIVGNKLSTTTGVAANGQLSGSLGSPNY